MFETSKAMKRRWREDANGIFEWKKLFASPALDVGSGNDPLMIPADCATFDKNNGDANHLALYFSPNCFALIHASQVLEHMIDAKSALLNWLKLIQPGGHVVCSVPGFELYEGKRDVSIWNPDHKSTWSMLSREGGKKLPHHYLPDFLSSLPKEFKVLRMTMLAENYDFVKGAGVDQSFNECDGVEPWLEFVIQKSQ